MEILPALIQTIFFITLKKKKMTASSRHGRHILDFVEVMIVGGRRRTRSGGGTSCSGMFRPTTWK
jgi:hypothetical protein